MKQLVINHSNSFSHKLLAVIMFEWPDYSLVKQLENACAVWGKKRNVHILQVPCILGISSTWLKEN
jgi:hypothetical protein